MNISTRGCVKLAFASDSRNLLETTFALRRVKGVFWHCFTRHYSGHLDFLLKRRGGGLVHMTSAIFLGFFRLPPHCPHFLLKYSTCIAFMQPPFLHLLLGNPPPTSADVISACPLRTIQCGSPLLTASAPLTPSHFSDVTFDLAQSP